MRLPILFLAAFLTMILSRCAKQTDTLPVSPVSDYYALEVGKYAIYKLDSSVYVSFGQVKDIRSHIIKDIVDARLTDNLGRASFRIRRQFRSTTDTSQWIDRATYLVTPLANSMEIIEDNMRFIKIQSPITEGFSWNGNRYLPDDIFPEYGFNSTAHSHPGSWDYIYENVNVSTTINGKSFDSTFTVSSAINDSTGFPPLSKNAPAFKTIWEEKYAKGVGLISKIISLEEFQPSTSTYPNGYYSGFALKQTLIGHN